MTLKLAFVAAVLWLSSAIAHAGCGPVENAGKDYIVCEFNPTTARIETFNLDAGGLPFKSFSGLSQYLEGEGKRLVFATNGGMFGVDYKPIGLYVEDGAQVRKLNRRNGGGNFHLKPNGVFYLQDGKAGVIESDRFAKADLRPDFATQSGPMLVINGKIHPKFSATGVSEKIRNGVGVKDDGTVVFALSEEPVNFHAFASLFKDRYACANALFFDGSVSSFYSEELGRDSQIVPLGPMVGVVEMK
jgi:prepilin-type processing-associated H-X9-DG protein